jgi:hypothetical protein
MHGSKGKLPEPLSPAMTSGRSCTAALFMREAKTAQRRSDCRERAEFDAARDKGIPNIGQRHILLGHC